MATRFSKHLVESLYQDAKKVIDASRAQAYYASNFSMVHAYWNVGRLIVENEQDGRERADYGEALVEALSEKLRKEYGKGFDKTNVWNMRKFYTTFPIIDALRQELSWTHYRLLMRIERDDSRQFYLAEAIESNWSTRTLERQINSLYFERMVMTKPERRGLVKNEALKHTQPFQPKDIIKDPYVLEFLELKSNTDFYEKELEQGLIDKLQEFLLELGKGFSFVGRQYRISTDHHDFYIDLVFYNFILKCFLLIDLKTGKLTHQDVGQMDMYVRIFEDKIRQDSDSPTIGLILCSEKDQTMVKYSLLGDNKQIFASKYKTYLPTEKELQEEIERERAIAEQHGRFKK